MPGIQKILVGVDAESLFAGEEFKLNPANEEAVNRAIWLAELSHAELTLFSALRIDHPESADLLEETAEAALLHRVRGALEALQRQAGERGVTARIKVASGRAWLEIIHEVLRSGQQLVVVGTGDAGAAERLLFGSTAMRLLRKCPCPVLVTHPRQEPEPEQKTILVADDFSEIGMRALNMGVWAARAAGARLLVLHAVEFPLAGSLHRGGLTEEEVEEYREKCKSEAEAKLNDRLATTDYRTVEAGTEVMIGVGRADNVIEDVIEEQSIDLLVMGTIARGGLPGFVLGNTAERLLPEIGCSVLAIKPDDFESPVTLEPES